MKALPRHVSNIIVAISVFMKLAEFAEILGVKLIVWSLWSMWLIWSMWSMWFLWSCIVVVE